MKNVTIKLFPIVGSFAENKDLAREIRQTQIAPAIQDGSHVVLDFTDVESSTQSFIHALISELFRQYREETLDKISFKNCNGVVRKLIAIVSDYMQ